MSTETGGLLPPIRSDIDVTPDPAALDRASYLLRDGRDHRVWQIGEGERTILRLLDGTRSLADVRDVLQQQNLGVGPAAPDLDDLAAFVAQLAREGLLEAHPAAQALYQHEARLLVRRIVTLPVRWALRWLLMAPWDLLTLRSRANVMRPRHTRLGNPDRLLAALAVLLRPLLGRVGLIAALVYSLLGVALLVGHFGTWWQAVDFLWNPWGMVLIVLTGVLLVHVPHQLAHGVVLVHHGARAPSWGVRSLFNVFPTLWLDVSDALWLTEKRWRLAVIAAGPLWQSMMLTTGIAGWLITERGVASLVFLALSSTALFGLILNANPLVRRDGYHLLSTWLEVPDLRDRATACLRAWVRWQPMPEPYTPRERRWFGVYSVAVNAFGILLTVTAALFALRLTQIYGETGATLVLFAGGFVFQDHIRSIFHSTGLARAGRWIPRTMVWVLWAAIGGAAVWAMFLPYTYHAGGSTTLVALEHAEVRSELEGLIGDVYVHEGAWVEQGQPLAMLHARVQERNLHAAEAQLAEARARQSALVAGRRPEEIERMRSAVLTAQAQLEWSSARAERYRPLFDQKVISLQEYENARQLQLVDERKLEEARAALAIVESGTRDEALEASQQGIRSQEAIVEHFRVNVERTALLSPISGYVTTPQVQHLRGRYLQPGQRDLVATIENTKVVVAEIEVPQEDIAGISVGNHVALYTWSYPGRRFEGTVSAIAPVASEDNLRQRSFVRVKTEIENADGALKPNMTGYAKIRVDERPVWDVLFRPLLRWVRIEVWSWLP
jgi:putative peptide zinc metalloprotease protein